MGKTLRVVLAVLSGMVLRSEAQQPVIESFAENVGMVFRPPTNGTVQHCYRVEKATSLVSAAWTPVRTIVGCDAEKAVTNAVSLTGTAAFYRVVATSNSAEYVDGPYLAIDVSGGASAISYPVAYYDGASAVPGGITDEVYKTTRILMRLVPKSTFRMGAPTNELGYLSSEAHHQVTLTKDFYVGVFEVTQKQWERVMGTWPSYFTNVIYRDSRPVEGVSYFEIRENPLPVSDQFNKGSAISPNWPQSSQVHADSFVGNLRSKTGLSTLDLPTEAQWECACRAGTAAALNSGRNLTNTASDAQVSALGRYWYNSGTANLGGDTSRGTAKVGTYLPNSWGLYDMHGNLKEWCLDWHEGYAGAATDPTGAESGSVRMYRGGMWSDFAASCRSSIRFKNSPSYRYYDVGFRLATTLH